jgi:hypothetical protein
MATTQLQPVGVSMGSWSAIDMDQRGHDVDMMLDIGFTWCRAGINWSGSEKPPQPATTGQAASMATMMLSKRMHWLCLFAYTPPVWSTAPPSVTAPYDRDKYPPTPDHYDEWERWVEDQVRAIVDAGLALGLTIDEIAQYIRFEIWNEENHAEFFGWPDPKIYVQLLKRARAAISRVSTKLRVIFGGMAPAPDHYGTALKPGQKPEYRASTFVEKCYEAGLTGDDFNAMNFHPYNGQVPLSETAGKSWDMNTTVYNELLDVMAKHGNPHKRVWSTEFGYGTANCRAPVSEVDQGNLLVAQIKYLRSRPTAGPSLVFCFLEWKPTPGVNGFSNYGIVRENRQWKPAANAIKAYLKTAPSH